MANPSAIERLRECWRVISTERDNADRLNDQRRKDALSTGMKIIDACLAIEEGLFATRDDYGKVTSNPDQGVVDRLREIARERDIFAHERKAAEAEGEPAA